MPDPAPTPAKDASEFQLALRVLTMPRETNIYGTIFGGVVLSYIDQAAFVQARRHGNHRWVTASIERVDFRAPVLVGDAVTLMARTLRVGRTSVGIEIQVQSERFRTARFVDVTTAHLTLVAVDEHGKPIPHVHPDTVKPDPVEGDS